MGAGNYELKKDEKWVLLYLANPAYMWSLAGERERKAGEVDLSKFRPRNFAIVRLGEAAWRDEGLGDVLEWDQVEPEGWKGSTVTYSTLHKALTKRHGCKEICNLGPVSLKMVADGIRRRLEPIQVFSQAVMEGYKACGDCGF